MNSLSIITGAFGWSIVHSIWQIALTGVVVKLLLLAFANSSPVLKHNIILGGFSAMFVMFCLTFALTFQQEWEELEGETLFPGSEYFLHDYAQPAIHDKIPEPAGHWLSTMTGILNGIDHSMTYIVIAWFAGFLVFALRFAGSYIYIYRLRTRYSFTLPEKWQATLRDIRSKLGLCKNVVLLESATTGIPMVIGFLKPAIILPLGLIAHIPFSQLEAILVHELAHIRRNDYIVNLIITPMEWLFFYHPVYWWLSNKLKTYREHCCDDITVSYCGDYEPLQNALLDISTYNQKPIHVAAALYKNDYQLLNRIKRMKTKNQKTLEKRFNPAILFLVIAVFILVIAGSSIAPRQDDMPPLKGFNDEKTHQSVRENNHGTPENVRLATAEKYPGTFPDTTKKAKQENFVTEKRDESIINLELDGEGNLRKVTKNGKELLALNVSSMKSLLGTSGS
jgi:beta-lactamase regulating signal transducer with metallopeptidase domain